MAVILDDWRYRPVPSDKKISMAKLDLSELGEQPLRLYGRTVGHPITPDGRYIYVSPPVYFNEATRLVRTASGSEYQLGKCGAKEKEEFGHIRADVLRHSEKIAKAAGGFAAPAETPRPSEPRAETNDASPDDDEVDLDSLIEKAIKAPRPREFNARPPESKGRKIYDAEAEVIEPAEQQKRR